MYNKSLQSTFKSICKQTSKKQKEKNFQNEIFNVQKIAFIYIDKHIKEYQNQKQEKVSSHDKR